MTLQVERQYHSKRSSRASVGLSNSIHFSIGVSVDDYYSLPKRTREITPGRIRQPEQCHHKKWKNNCLSLNLSGTDVDMSFFKTVLA